MGVTWNRWSHSSIYNKNDANNIFSSWYKISFEIKNEIEGQCQSSPKLTGILTVLKCILGPNLVLSLFRSFTVHYENIQSRRKWCYTRPASVIINNNTVLKCWPCRGTTPPDQFQAFLTEYIDTRIFASILDVFQLKTRVKLKLSTWMLSPVIAQYMRPYFQHLVDKGLIWDMWPPSCKFQLSVNLSTTLHTICCPHYVGKNLEIN